MTYSKINTFFYGLILIFIGITLPYYVTEETFNVYYYLKQSLIYEDSGLLIISALMLIILNSLRALPLYIGSFIIVSSLKKDKFNLVIETILITFFLGFCYKMIEFFYDVTYDFGMPSFIVIIAIIILDRFELINVNLLKKILVITLILMGAQCLDLVPPLTPYGFGGGEISMDIKTTAQIIDDFNVLNIACVAFMTIFFLNALLIARLLRDQHILLEASKTIANANLQAVEARSTKETQNLVHDLKTPLTSIQMLSNVTEMIVDDPKAKAYLNKISQAVDNLDVMISQILNINKKSNITIEELFNYIFSQIIIQDLKDRIKYIPDNKNVIVYVNKIRFSRAIINLINNAYKAIENMENGKIILSVNTSKGFVEITLDDNGIGIPNKNLEQIWQIGYSKNESTGLGLNFVKEVITRHEGDIEINSLVGVGTTVTIIMNKAGEEK